VGARAKSYLHVLMYAQADYFQIDRLRARAKKHFRASFLDQLDRESFQAIVVEIYRLANEFDRGLRDMVVELTIDNLATLRGGISPVLDNDLLKIVPDFAVDLCIATLDKFSINQTQSIDVNAGW